MLSTSIGKRAGNGCRSINLGVFRSAARTGSRLGPSGVSHQLRMLAEEAEDIRRNMLTDNLDTLGGDDEYDRPCCE